MKMRYFILVLCLIGSVSCKEKIVVGPSTSEMYFQELIGTWDVEIKGTKIIDGVVDDNGTGTGNYVIIISEDNKISTRFANSQEETIEDIFIGEQLDQVIIIGPPNNFMLGEFTTSTLRIFQVLTKESQFQIWESIENFENIEGENIKLISEWKMTKR